MDMDMDMDMDNMNMHNMHMHMSMHMHMCMCMLCMRWNAEIVTTLCGAPFGTLLLSRVTLCLT